MKKEEKILVNNKHTFLELPIEKEEFYKDKSVLEYINSLEDCSKLSEKDLKTLLLKKGNDKDARNKLIKMYMYLPILIAKEYSLRTTLSNMDLISEGNMGLIKAVDDYSLIKGDFYSFLVKKIRKSIVYACITKAKVSSDTKSAYYERIRLNELEEELEKEYSRKPIDEELLCEWKDRNKSLKENNFKLLNNTRYEVSSLDEIDSETLLGEDTSIDLDKQILLDNLRDLFFNILDSVHLTEEEKIVITSLFGLTEQKSAQELSLELGLKLSRIRHIEKMALQKLQRYAYSKLDPYRDLDQSEKSRK